MTTRLQPISYGTIPIASPARDFSPLAGTQDPLEFLIDRATRLFTVLLAWNERARQRHDLSQLDDRLLKDIGVSRVAAAHEAAKPPWEN